MKRPIFVTKTFLPPIEDYMPLLTEVWESGWITNNGKCLRSLEQKLKERFDVKHLFVVSNGTIAIQIAIQAMDLSGEVITTPFSYVATTSCIVWEKCKPRFVDIDPTNFCIDANKIEEQITDKTSAILATNVFGGVCDFEKIRAIADKYKLKIIYDSAHAFGVKQKGVSVMNEGDISTLSFHATKVFHTVEGGAITTNDDGLAERIRLLRNFGHSSQVDISAVGINGKNSELHAAMGLANLKHFHQNTLSRKVVWDRYFNQLNDRYKKLNLPKNEFIYNYAYFPIVLESEEELLRIIHLMNKEEIYPRRYFYPSLNTLNYIEEEQPMPISESISNRVICLPLYPDLARDDQDFIIALLNKEATR